LNPPQDVSILGNCKWHLSESLIDPGESQVDPAELQVDPAELQVDLAE
jgi:hypothetical protein